MEFLKLFLAPIIFLGWIGIYAFAISRLDERNVLLVLLGLLVWIALGFFLFLFMNGNLRQQHIKNQRIARKQAKKNAETF